LDNASAQTLDTALITGASSGIGAEFARQLASRGYGLCLVARREERLGKLASELERSFSMPAEVIVADLSQGEDLERVASRIIEMPALEILVNNAGFGLSGSFARIDYDIHRQAVQVHVLASLRLTHAALPGMLARRSGGIINVASMAGLFPVRNVTYGATKAFLVHFTRTLHHELHGTGLRLQALCPGLVDTEFHRLHAPMRLPGFMWSTADRVVAESLAALERGQVICIPGRIYRLIAALGTTPLTYPLISFATRGASRKRPG